MVNISKYSHRFAFTMIELIFAIVIIAISVMSLPMVTQVTNKGIENSLVQEAVFAASADLMGVTSAYWDTNSMRDVNKSNFSRVIDVNTTHPCDSNRLKPGHIKQPYHRRCLDENASSAGVLNTISAEFDTLNNYHQPAIATMFDLPGTSGTAEGYKQLYQNKITIEHLTDSDIKTITVEIYDESGTNPVTLLKAQVANIGEVDIYKRTF